MMALPPETPRARWAFLLAPVVIYVLLASCHVGDPFTNDETWEFYASKTLLEDGAPKTVTGQTNVLHPHGYYYLVSWAFGLFGVSEAAARSVGIGATVLCYFLVLRMVRYLGRRDGEVRPRTCLLAGLFYLFSPVVVQGSLVVTADTGIHHLVILLFLLYFIERYPFAPLDLAALSVLFALTLWAKVVAPCLVLASIVSWLLLRREWKRAFLVGTVVGVGGFLIFFAFWTRHCRSLNADPLWVVLYLWKVLTSRKVGLDPSAGLINAARGTVVLLAWLGPPFALLMLRSALHLGRPDRLAARPMAGLLLLCGSVLLLVHTLISGIGYGFPRYHATMMPIWAVLLTLATDEALGDERPAPIAWAAAGLAAVWLFLVADPLRTLNFDLKASALGPPHFPARPLAAVALEACLFLAPLAAGLVISRRLRSAPARASILLALTAAHSLSLDAIQARASYLTHYGYGEVGTREMLAHCAGHLEKGKKVLSCMDVVYHLTDRDYMEDWHWNEKEFLLERLNDRDTQLVVMGLTHNTLSQLRSMTGDADLRGILERSFSLRRIGSYFIWERKKEDPRKEYPRVAARDHAPGPSS